MSGLYILDDNNQAVEEPDLLTWATWLGENEHRRQIAHTQITDNIRVSTIFLGIDFGFSLDDTHPPVLWETMIFDGDKDPGQWRYTGREQALAHHDQLVAEQRNKLCNTSKSASEDTGTGHGAS